MMSLEDIKILKNLQVLLSVHLNLVAGISIYQTSEDIQCRMFVIKILLGLKFNSSVMELLRLDFTSSDIEDTSLLGLKFNSSDIE